MSTPYWFCLFVLLSAAGCGRLGVQLLLLDIDAAAQPMDGGARSDAGKLPAGGRSGSGSGSDSGSGSGSGAGSNAGAGAGSSAGVGAAADSGIDAGLPYQGDAGTMTDAGNAIDCGGALQFNLCWYLAAADTSCTNECTNKGGVDSRAPNYIGTPAQGGSTAECEQVLTALGRPGPVAAGTQEDGLGCHLWNNGDRWWLQSPAFSANASTPNGTGARIVCACQR
jgi:hypothetical protein